MTVEGSSRDFSRSADPAALEVSVLTAPDALDEIPADQWDALVDALPRPSPYLLHGWLVSRARHALGASVPRFHVAWRAGRLVGALPLEIVRHAGFRIGRFAAGPSATWLDVMLAQGEPVTTARELVVSARNAGCDFYHLDGIAHDALVGEIGDLGMVARFENCRFDFGRGWDVVYREVVSKRHRQDYQRKRRLLGERGRLETRVARSAEELGAVLDETFRLHELRWRGHYDASRYASAPTRLAMAEAVQRLAARDSYRIVTVELDGRPIAFLSVFILRGSAIGHRTAFDPAFGDYSPGALVFFDAFEACEAEGVVRFEFGGGADQYKHRLADDWELVYDAVGLVRGVRGALGAATLKQVLRQRQRMQKSTRMRAVYKRGRDLVYSR